MDCQNDPEARQGGDSLGHPPSRRDRFFASYFWLIAKNVIGWVLIVAAFVLGPAVPGPGGIPLFLIGFALVSFPGKRRLTARVLRGRPVRFPGVHFALVCIWVALTLPALVLVIIRHRPRWLARTLADAFERGPLAIAAVYLIMAAIAWVFARSTPHLLDLLLRAVAKARRAFRPWLRRHRIRLLPPRWRKRRLHEPGSGPRRLKDEILKFTWKRRV